MKTTNAEKAVSKLNYNLGAIRHETQTLFGVRDLLDDIEESMNEAEHHGENAVQLIYVHNRMRAVTELVRNSMEKLENARTDAVENSECLFDFHREKEVKEVGPYSKLKDYLLVKGFRISEVAELLRLTDEDTWNKLNRLNGHSFTLDEAELIGAAYDVSLGELFDD